MSLLLHLFSVLGHGLAHGLRRAAGGWPLALHRAAGLGAGSLRASTLLVVFDRGLRRRAAGLPPNAAEAATLTPQAAWALAALPQTSALVLQVRTEADAGPALDWLERLRATAPAGPPALLLLPGDSEAQRLAALHRGADAVLPYQAGPALVEAQLARLRALRLQAPPGPEPGRLRFGAGGACIGSQALALRPGPLRLLCALAAEPGRVFSLARLQGAVRSGPTAQPGLVHAYASRVRQALRPHGLAHQLQTVHGVGYRFVADAAAAAGPVAQPPARSEPGQESAMPASRPAPAMGASQPAQTLPDVVAHA